MLFSALLFGSAFPAQAARRAHATDARRVLVVSGLAQEGSIAAGDAGVLSVLSGGSLDTLRQRLAEIDPATVRAVISFGVAGGLHPNLVAGDIVISSEVVTDDGTAYPVSPRMQSKLYGPFQGRGLRAFGGAMVGSPEPHYTAQSKAALYAATHAISVDMESGGAAEYAARNQLPFGVLRTISDAQGFTLPPAASTALNPDGSLNLGAVLSSIFKDPSQLPALLQLGFDSSRAFSSLRTCAGLVPLGQL